VLAQRLMRSFCKACKQRVECPPEEWDKLRYEYGNEAAWEALKLDRKAVPYHVPKGCDKCNGTGYKGRVGIHELLVSDDDTRLMIYRKAKSMEIRDLAVKQGMILLKQDGIRKILQGYTDLREVLSVAAK
jgi:type II secretory ATPase GspE/PulE/Tfp pilus assembly ATPase PilB-like protein